MKELVLLYNFSGDRLKTLRLALMSQKMMSKVVSVDDYKKPLGVIAKINKEQETEETLDDIENFSDEMIVMSGFTSDRINALISTLRKHKIGRINLKAVITPTNISWNSIELYKAVKADFEEMNKK